jgi:hypothetical protein
MAEQHFLNIRLAGNSIGRSRIPISHLLRLLTEFNKVMLRVGRILQGQSDSIRKGRTQSSIKDEIALDLVQITHGSPATVLGLERSCGQKQFECMDIGQEIIEKALLGLKEIQTDSDDLPTGFDIGVIMAWRDLGIMFDQGVSNIQFKINHRAKTIITDYSTEGYKRVQERIQGPVLNVQTIEGRLLMADFKEHGTRCRIHPSFGDPIICIFNEDQKDSVYDNILNFVKIIGEAKEDPITGKISSITLKDIQRLEDREQEGRDLLPQGSDLPIDFWESPSLDTLAAMQGVKPIQDVTKLYGSWPGEKEDGFETLIDDLRKSNIHGEVKP